MNMTNKNFFYRSKNELNNKKDKRSLFCIKDIKKNERFTIENIGCLRPNIGLDSSFYFKLLNKKSNSNIKVGPLKKKHISNIFN